MSKQSTFGLYYNCSQVRWVFKQQKQGFEDESLLFSLQNYAETYDSSLLMKQYYSTDSYSSSWILQLG